MATADDLIAQIRGNITDPEDAAAMMADVRSAFDREDWGSAVESLTRTATPTMLDGVLYESTSKAAWAIDSAAHAVWDGIRDLMEPAIEAESEATADNVIDGRAAGREPDTYLSAMRYWLAACPEKDVYRIPLDRIVLREHFRDATKAYITRVVQDSLHYAVEAEYLKDQLTEAQCRALMWPFADLGTGNAIEEN
ncbi:hypothetical protein ACWC4D_40855 [Streptomyces sp. NPDC001288]